jgi:hypothetical protein
MVNMLLLHPGTGVETKRIVRQTRGAQSRYCYIFGENKMHRLLVVLTLWLTIMGSYAHASMVPTQSIINSGTDSYSQQELQSALASVELREQLADLGVDADQLSDRINSLTPAEIVQLNSELEQQPAGGIIGVIVLIFVVFVVTDMLCATNIFAFVKCINK